MEGDISKQIAQLPDLSKQQLLDLWLELYERAAPLGIRRELMIPFLAYRIQEKAYGGLKPTIRTKLLRIARALEKGSPSPELPFHIKAKPGTRIIREWRGKTHEVFVAESGYEYQGTTFTSLSQIARRITGTRWSGPAFFGLNKPRIEKDHSDD